MIHVSFLETFTRLSLSGKGVNRFSFDFIDLNNISHHESGCVNKREIEYIDRACIFAQYLFALIGRYVKQRETVSSPISIELSRVLIVFFFLLFFFFFFFRERLYLMDTIEHASRRRAPFSIENGTNFLLDAFNGQNAFRTLRFIRTFSSLFFVFFFHTPTFHGFGYIHARIPVIPPRLFQIFSFTLTRLNTRSTRKR